MVRNSSSVFNVNSYGYEFLVTHRSLLVTADLAERIHDAGVTFFYRAIE